MLRTSTSDAQLVAALSNLDKLPNAKNVRDVLCLARDSFMTRPFTKDSFKELAESL